VVVDHGDMAHITVDSCHSRWIFDHDQRRFRRIVKGPRLDDRVTTTDWRPYVDLLADPYSDAFVVLLNESGTRMLRLWRHTDRACPQCGETETQERFMHQVAEVVGL